MKNNNEFIMLQSLLSEFDFFQKQFPGPVSNSVQLDFKTHNKHIVFTSIVHGDEVGSVPSIIKTIKNLISKKLTYGGRVTFVLGNVEAAQKNLRYIETDLNRSFGKCPKIKLSHERKRALELMPLLQNCDLLFDFHQTKMKTQYPFYTFEFDKKSYLWARVAGITPMFVTRRSGQNFSSAGLCIDEYVRLFNKPAVTIELSEKGFNNQAEILTSLAIKRIFNAFDKISSKQSSLNRLADKNQDFNFFFTTHREKFSHPKQYLKEEYSNFREILKNECVGFDENKKPLLSPESGFILFPKYPKRDAEGNSVEALSEIYLLVKKINPDFFCLK